MFAYCLNNPVIAKDSGGGVPTCCVMVQDGSGSGKPITEVFSSFSELSITVGPSTVVIDAYIVFEGDLDADTLIQGIKDYWEGDYDFSTGTKSVTVNIHCGTTSDGRAIYVNSIDGNGTGNTYPAFRDGGVSIVTIYSRYKSGNKQNVGWEMAHEFGHCLGIDDYYTLLNKGVVSTDLCSIMNRTATHAQSWDICMAIWASQYGNWQKW